MRTLVSILTYICFISAPVGFLVAIITALYGKFTGRPPSTLIDDTRTNDVIHLVGMLLLVLGLSLGLVGFVLAIVFITPKLSDYVRFVASLFSL